MKETTAAGALARSEAISALLARPGLPASEYATLKRERAEISLALLHGALTPAPAAPLPVTCGMIGLLVAFLYAIPAVPIIAAFLWASGLLRVYRGNMKW
jgi:hypothetical protein